MKFLNWSKLAQAGESTTASPGRACAAADCTARSSVSGQLEGNGVRRARVANSAAASPIR